MGRGSGSVAPTAVYTPLEGVAGDPMQLFDTYLLVPEDDRLLIIDQHALHERLNFDTLRTELEDNDYAAQQLAVPVLVDVPPAQAKLLDTNTELLARIGIEIEPFGHNTLAVQTFPVLLEKADPVEFVIETLDKMIDEAGDTDEERLVHEVLDMASCKAAIKAGQPLSDDEISQLLKDKDLAMRTSRCPHGRPTTIMFSIKELEKQFKRTGF